MRWAWWIYDNYGDDDVDDDVDDDDEEEEGDYADLEEQVDVSRPSL